MLGICSKPFLQVKILNSSNSRYTQNGILHMLDRNKRIKPRPERFQNCKDVFDLILTCEERVYDQVVEGKELELINQINFWVFFFSPKNLEISLAPPTRRVCSYWCRFMQQSSDGWALSPKGPGSSMECVCTALKKENLGQKCDIWDWNGKLRTEKKEFWSKNGKFRAENGKVESRKGNLRGRATAAPGSIETIPLLQKQPLGR